MTYFYVRGVSLGMVWLADLSPKASLPVAWGKYAGKEPFSYQLDVWFLFSPPSPIFFNFFPGKLDLVLCCNWLLEWAPGLRESWAKFSRTSDFRPWWDCWVWPVRYGRSRNSRASGHIHLHIMWNLFCSKLLRKRNSNWPS